MATVFIILVIVMLISVAWGFLTEWDSAPTFWSFLSAFLVIMISLSLIRVSFSSKTLTGYIYSVDEAFGYTTGHIRFSEQAGTDAQPSFCVAANSDAGKKVKELVGSGKKVTVSVPAYSYIANSVWQCGSKDTVITIVE